MSEKISFDLKMAESLEGTGLLGWRKFIPPGDEFLRSGPAKFIFVRRSGEVFIEELPLGFGLVVGIKIKEEEEGDELLVACMEKGSINRPLVKELIRFTRIVVGISFSHYLYRGERISFTEGIGDVPYGLFTTLMGVGLITKVQ